MVASGCGISAGVNKGINEAVNRPVNEAVNEAVDETQRQKAQRKNGSRASCQMAISWTEEEVFHDGKKARCFNFDVSR